MPAILDRLLGRSDADRASMKARVAKRQSLIQERDELLQKDAAIEVRIASGELTTRALTSTRARLAAIGAELSAVDNTLKNKLRDSCTDAGLCSQRETLRRKKADLGRRINAQKTALAEPRERVRLEAQQLAEREEHNGKDATWQSLARDLELSRAELADPEADLAELEHEMSTNQAVLESVYLQMEQS